MSFRILIASIPDREKVVTEIWHDDSQIVEISNEHNSTTFNFTLIHLARRGELILMNL
jgi:hypothetical protein